MFTMYIFMYDNVVFEITCEIRLMFDFTRVDTQVTLVASAQLERAAWVCNSHSQFQSHVVYMRGAFPG